MIEQILVVCTGNICRSPVAEGLLSLRLPKVTVRSAGIAAATGYPVDASTRDVAKELASVDIAEHRSRLLTQEICDDADLILVMEQSQKRLVERQFSRTFGKVYCLDPDEDVVDPYQRSRRTHEICVTHIVTQTERWARRIRNA